MTDVRSSVAAVAERIREQRGPLDSRRAVQLRAVEPLLEALGWDVRSTDVEPDASVDGLAVDYLLQVDGRPAVAVLTAAPDADAAGERERELVTALASGPVDWGLVTDGWHLSLLAREDGDVHRRRLAAADLADEPSALDGYARSAAARRAASSQEVGRARKRLGERRAEAVAAVADAISSVAGDALREPAREAAERVVDDLATDREPTTGESAARAPSAGQSPAGNSTSGDPGREPSPDGASPDARAPPSRDDGSGDEASRESGDGASGEADASGEGSPSGEVDPDAGTDQSGESPDVAGDLSARDEGEYVVRFFGGRSSVGAVGTDTPAGTLVGAVTFLRESHALDGSVELPWGVEDGRATIASAPEHPDGTAMSHYRELDGGWYVWTGGGERWARAAIEGLADVVGLRVMYQGDW